MNFRKLLLWVRRVAPASAGSARIRPATGAPDPAAAIPEALDERPLGCGWFDSSHELQHGLLVREAAPTDALAAELPLAWWLDLQLGTPRTVQSPARPGWGFASGGSATWA